MSRRNSQQSSRRFVPKAASTAFSPTSLANLALWTRSDNVNGTTNGNPVSQWTDLSGNANHLIASLTARPTYTASDAGVGGKASLAYNGTSNVMHATSAIAMSQTTQFLVVKNTVADAFLYYVDDAGSIEYIYADVGFSGFVSRNAVGGSSGQYNVSGGWGNNAAFRTITRSFGGTVASFDLRINGAAQSLTTSGTDPGVTAETGTIYVGASATPSSFVTGAYAEVIVYSRALSTPEKQQVESYLRTRYGHY